MPLKDKIMSISNKIVITEHQVRFSDGDPAGIVYFANFPMYFDESFIQLAKSKNFDWSSRDRKFIIPIVEQKVTYKAPLTVGLDYHVITAIIHIGNRSLRSGHILYVMKEGKPVLGAYGYIARAVVDPEQFVATQMPQELADSLSHFFVTEEQWQELIALFK